MSNEATTSETYQGPPYIFEFSTRAIKNIGDDPCRVMRQLVGTSLYSVYLARSHQYPDSEQSRVYQIGFASTVAAAQEALAAKEVPMPLQPDTADVFEHAMELTDRWHKDEPAQWEQKEALMEHEGMFLLYVDEHNRAEDPGPLYDGVVDAYTLLSEGVVYNQSYSE